MKRIIVTIGTGLLVMVPAAIGLVGNTSFAQNVPVHVPPQATVVNDSGQERDVSTAEPRDDKGGQRERSTAEPGDDRGGQNRTGAPSPTDDKGDRPGISNPGSGGGAAGDRSSGKGQNGGHGGSSSPSGGTDDGSAHR